MQPTATVLVYSDDSNTREQVRLATGRRPATDVPLVEFVECATPAAVLKELDKRRHRRLRAGRRGRSRWAAWVSAGRSRTRSSTARRCWC